MNEHIASKQAICEKLIEKGKKDKDIVVLTSDSRGSASMAPFADTLPDQLVEIGIAEQDMVGQAAGLAAAGKKAFIASYAAFLSMRSIEQIKVDVAYSEVPVSVIGISGGVSYGPLGMSHHAVQDIAAIRGIPNIELIMPASPRESEVMVEKLIDYNKPVYVRVERNPIPEIYHSENVSFKIGKAKTLKKGDDLTIIACGRMVNTALQTAEKLAQKKIDCRVINNHTLKPLDDDTIIKAAVETEAIITLEEHSIYGGLGSAVSEVVVQNNPAPVKVMGLPDEPIVAGKPAEIFKHYGLDTAGVAQTAERLLDNM